MKVQEKLPLLLVGSLVVAAGWTWLTGQWWHWAPVLLAVAIVTGMVRSLDR